MGLGLLFGELSQPERSSWAMDASLLHGNGVTGDLVYYPLSTKCFQVSHTEINWRGQLTLNCLCLQMLCCQVVRNMWQTIPFQTWNFLPRDWCLLVTHGTEQCLLYCTAKPHSCQCLLLPWMMEIKTHGAKNMGPNAHAQHSHTHTPCSDACVTSQITALIITGSCTTSLSGYKMNLPWPSALSLSVSSPTQDK